MAGEHPARPGWSLGRRYGESSVRGFDVTCSTPKSVSILFAVGDEKTRSEVLEGHDQAVSAVVDWIERNALTRYRDADASIRGASLAKDCPAEISGTVGARPADAQAATAWDQAAGRLEQLHASFGTAQGLGPDSYYARDDLADSRQRAE